MPANNPLAYILPKVSAASQPTQTLPPSVQTPSVLPRAAGLASKLRAPVPPSSIPTDSVSNAPVNPSLPPITTTPPVELDPRQRLLRAARSLPGAASGRLSQLPPSALLTLFAGLNKARQGVLPVQPTSGMDALRAILSRIQRGG